MQKPSLFLALTAGALLWGFGALEARAGFVPLPTTLDQLLIPGNFTTVQQPNETETFSGFTYTVNPINSPPPAANITVNPFLPNIGLESGLVFNGAFNALPGTTVDYGISYTVTAPPGFLINDAFLSAAMGNNGGTGMVSIVELLIFPNGGSQRMEVSLPPSNNSSASLQFAGVPSILVQKDILLEGGILPGGLGANVTFVDQGFSSVPEPTSMISLSIGMSILLVAYRRFSKRSSVARSKDSGRRLWLK
jgi:hypothetical protein